MDETVVRAVCIIAEHRGNSALSKIIRDARAVCKFMIDKVSTDAAPELLVASLLFVSTWDFAGVRAMFGKNVVNDILKIFQYFWIDDDGILHNEVN